MAWRAPRLAAAAGGGAVIAAPAGGGGGQGPQVALEPNVALLVVAAWLVGTLIIAVLLTGRAEIAG